MNIFKKRKKAIDSIDPEDIFPDSLNSPGFERDQQEAI